MEIYPVRIILSGLLAQVVVYSLALRALTRHRCFGDKGDVEDITEGVPLFPLILYNRRVSAHAGRALFALTPPFRLLTCVLCS